MQQFSTTMEQVVHKDIPWRSIADRLVVIRNKNQVKYMTLFQDVKVEFNAVVNNTDVSVT